MKIPARINPRCIVISQIFQAVGKVGRLRHRCAVDQEGNDGDPAFERLLHLDPDRVVLFPNSCPPEHAAARPFGTDHRDQNIGIPKRILDGHAEIEPIGNAVDVHEDRLGAIMARQLIANASSNRLRVIAPV